MATTIERPRSGRDRGGRMGGRTIATEPDRLTVALLALAGFLAVLALLASQLRTASPTPLPRLAVLRRIYVTRVVETVPGGKGASSVTQSTSSTGSYRSAAPPTTRSS